MEYQKFIPEGWCDTKEEFSMKDLKNAYEKEKILQGFAYKCDENFNIHLNLGNGISGIIPREEVDAISVDEFGNTKIGVCKNKVNNFVQFKVKDLSDKNNIILSRKEVGIEAYKWAYKELKPGDIVNGIVKNIRPYGAFVEIGRWGCRYDLY